MVLKVTLALPLTVIDLREVVAGMVLKVTLALPLTVIDLREMVAGMVLTDTDLLVVSKLPKTPLPSIHFPKTLILLCMNQEELIQKLRYSRCWPWLMLQHISHNKKVSRN